MQNPPMDTEAVVIEFLSHVPLLQRLPKSSLEKIAEVIQTKHYNRGDYLAREGELGDGIYLIWEGEAEVCGSFNVDEENNSELQLKAFDYFGYGVVASVHQADVIAISKLICLVLPNQYSTLLQPKSIWNSDETLESRSMIELILQLDPIEALAAASKTVDCHKLVHSLHSYFLLAGDFGMPIIYQVHRIRDGNSFATRRVDATQKGNIIFTLLASFQKEEQGFEHQEVTMPFVLSPEMLLSMEELRERRLTDPRLPRSYRNKVAAQTFTPWPVDIRFCEPTTYTNQTKTPPSLKYWFKAKGKLTDDLALHRCVVAYISDLILLSVSLNPHRRRGLKTASLSLDHSVSKNLVPASATQISVKLVLEPFSFPMALLTNVQLVKQVVDLTNKGYDQLPNKFDRLMEAIASGNPTQSDWTQWAELNPRSASPAPPNPSFSYSSSAFPPLQTSIIQPSITRYPSSTTPDQQPQQPPSPISGNFLQQTTGSIQQTPQSYPQFQAVNVSCPTTSYMRGRTPHPPLPHPQHQLLSVFSSPPPYFTALHHTPSAGFWFGYGEGHPYVDENYGRYEEDNYHKETGFERQAQRHGRGTNIEALARALTEHTHDLHLKVLEFDRCGFTGPLELMNGYYTWQSESPSASNARGFCTGRMYNTSGELVMSLTQEGLIRTARTPDQAPKAKL
ncbi:hypothetical protein GIB67_022811 [Kingdonia uniflora]|uniref:Cyclic nucleotide-binding domain-containing protein n=1 Tax=Kingdonia uniflora TaxID=39325 RepID=A0A7J7P706_9MAGN|nr:hypothetical protein GIB67_022811 [Kingdonia uniflora]